MGTRTVAFACSLLVAFAAPAQAADDVTAEARRHVNQAKVHYKLGEFDKSVAEWKEAYRLKPVPAILFNLAQAYRMAGNFRESRFHYENYLRDMPNAPNRQEVERQIEQLAGLIAEEERSAPPTRPEEGAKDVVVAKPDLSTKVGGVEPATGAGPKQLALRKSVIEPRPAPVVETSSRERLPWIVGAASLALAVGGAVTYGLARGSWSEATGAERPRAEVDALIASGDTKYAASLGLGGAAVLAGAGAAVLFVF